MANFNKIEIKALKSFKDHEGMNIFQGNIYYKGKKLGFWCQDYNGGICDNYDFDESILNEEVEKFKKSKYCEKKYAEYTTLDTILAFLVNLKADEKDYKKNIKNGFPITYIITDNFHYGIMGMKTEKFMETKDFKKWKENTKKTFFKNSKISEKIYKSLEDFNISV